MSSRIAAVERKLKADERRRDKAREKFNEAEKNWRNASDENSRARWLDKKGKAGRELYRAEMQVQRSKRDLEAQKSSLR